MEYRDRVIEIINKNKELMQVFDEMRNFNFESYYIGAGCITQSIWNDLTNRPLHYGIGDIDIIYFDDQDLSYEAEDKVIRIAEQVFSDIHIKIDIKNQARVHMWYKDKFGIELEPFRSLEQAIDTWPTTATAFGVRKELDGNWKVYAPFGFSDLFNLTVRPNKRLITEDIFMNKATKWKRKWPELTIVMWE